MLACFQFVLIHGFYEDPFLIISLHKQLENYVHAYPA